MTKDIEPQKTDKYSYEDLHCACRTIGHSVVFLSPITIIFLQYSNKTLCSSQTCLFSDPPRLCLKNKLSLNVFQLQFNRCDAGCLSTYSLSYIKEPHVKNNLNASLHVKLKEHTSVFSTNGVHFTSKLTNLQNILLTIPDCH